MGSDCGPDRHLTSSNNRAKNLKLLLCVLALGTLLASAASPQVLEGTILLPDTLGPLIGQTHVTFDEDSVQPRIFIGGEDGDVIVAEALTGERIARIRSGPMNALCYVPAHDELYVSTTDELGVVVVDCGSYEVIKRLSFTSLVTGLYYNPAKDRVYCATNPLMVVDCTGDSIVDSLPMNATGAECALDGTRNKLYVSAKDSLKVVDCDRDSVVARLFGPRGAQAICFQPSAGKVYVAAGESLFAVNTEADSVVYRRKYDTLDAQLACDSLHNRVYYTYWGHTIALDCATDTAIWSRELWGRAIGLAPDAGQDKLYMMLHATGYGYTYVLNGANGEASRCFPLTHDSSLYYSAAVERVFLASNGGEVTVIDCHADTVLQVIPLAPHISSVCVDSADNKLYFSMGNSGIGSADCSTNRVTSYIRVCDVPYSHVPAQCLAINSRDRKLYYSGDTSIYVLDCAADTLTRVISVGGYVQTLDWNADSNKLYAVVIRDTITSVVVSIDCSSDSVVKAIALNPSGYWDSHLTLMASEFGQLWAFSRSEWYAVIDCRTGSIVGDTFNEMANYMSADYSPVARKVYATHNRGLAVMDADSRLPVGGLPFSGAWSPQVHCATEARKAYWLIVPSVFPVEESVAVVDTRTDSISSMLSVPFLSFAMCGDHTGDYIYVAGDRYTSAGGFVYVVDTRTDSVVSYVGTPVAARFLVRNGKTNRLYVAGYPDTVIQVIYDSVIFAGVWATPGVPPNSVPCQTVVSRNTPLRSPTEAVLFDACGRRAAVLKAGPNDVSHLAPGVYFVREEPHASSPKPQAVRKIVVTR